MLYINNLDALIESLKSKGYDVKYTISKREWLIDGEIVDENDIPLLISGKRKVKKQKKNKK